MGQAESVRTARNLFLCLCCLAKKKMTMWPCAVFGCLNAIKTQDKIITYVSLLDDLFNYVSCKNEFAQTEHGFVNISLRKMMYWHMFVWFQKCQGRLKGKKHQIWSSFSIANTFCMGKKLMNPWLCLLAQWPSRVGPRTFLPCTPSSTNMFTVCFSKMRSTWQPRLPRHRSVRRNSK